MIVNLKMRLEFWRQDRGSNIRVDRELRKRIGKLMRRPSDEGANFAVLVRAGRRSDGSVVLKEKVRLAAPEKPRRTARGRGGGAIVSTGNGERDLENHENGGRKPVLMVVVGRQRVGKTSFLNALAQYLQERGAEFAIWDTDQMNTTNNMSVFHAEASSPPRPSGGKMSRRGSRRAFSTLLSVAMTRCSTSAAGIRRSRSLSRTCRLRRRFPNSG